MPTVRTNGIDTYYERYGDGPPVVAIHGALSDGRVLAEQLRPLADAYELIVYDVRGHGRTGRSARPSYSMALFADDLATLCRELGLDRPAIVGHSMGGMLVQSFGVRSPETPRALVAMGAHTPNARHPRDWLYFRAYARLMYLSTRVVPRTWVMAAADRVEDRLVDGRSDVGDRVAAIRADHGGTVPDPEPAEFHKVSRAILDFFADPIDLGAVVAPTLLAYGEREPDATARHARVVADAVPDGRRRTIPDAGHTIHVERPSLVVATLREFLDGRQ
jgi:pimeloyl-ACP methyl ester carboxylesterase